MSSSSLTPSSAKIRIPSISTIFFGSTTTVSAVREWVVKSYTGTSI